jgi:hypothetical protein
MACSGKVPDYEWKVLQSRECAHASAHHGVLSPQVPALRLLSQIPPQHASAHDGVLSPQVPDFEWEEHPITRVCRRKFAFAREVAGYDVQVMTVDEP